MKWDKLGEFLFLRALEIFWMNLRGAKKVQNFYYSWGLKNVEEIQKTMFLNKLRTMEISLYTDQFLDIKNEYSFFYVSEIFCLFCDQGECVFGWRGSPTYGFDLWAQKTINNIFIVGACCPLGWVAARYRRYPRYPHFATLSLSPSQTTAKATT